MPDKVSPCSDNILEVQSFAGHTENGLRACTLSDARPLEVYYASNGFYPSLSDGDSHVMSVDDESKSIYCGIPISALFRGDNRGFALFSWSK